MSPPREPLWSGLIPRVRAVFRRGATVPTYTHRRLPEGHTQPLPDPEPSPSTSPKSSTRLRLVRRTRSRRRSRQRHETRHPRQQQQTPRLLRQPPNQHPSSSQQEPEPNPIHHPQHHPHHQTPPPTNPPTRDCPRSCPPARSLMGNATGRDHATVIAYQARVVARPIFARRRDCAVRRGTLCGQSKLHLTRGSRVTNIAHRRENEASCPAATGPSPCAPTSRSTPDGGPSGT